MELERGQITVAPPPGQYRRINNQRTMAVPPQGLKDLVKLPVAAEWKHLGLRLDVPLYKLNEIQANHEHSPNAPINVMPHLPPPEGGGDKGGDLTTFPSNSPPLGLSS